MFRNFVNRHDVLWVLRHLGAGRALRRLFARVFESSRQRVEGAWSHVDAPPTNWWDVPAVRARWNLRMTGDPGVTWPQHVARRYLKAGSVRAVSLGCGTGAREVAWAATGVFREICGWDLSESRIAAARMRAQDAGLQAVLRFEVGDVYEVLAGEGSHDVVVCEHALHHFSPLDEIVSRIEAVLRPGGLLLVDDFVGPSRYQWSDRQIEAVNYLLGLLPRRLKVEWGGTTMKRPIFRPSRLRMVLLDPSEASESSRILALLESRFDVLERRDYGGALLHLLLGGIAHHFCGDDELAARFLRVCCEVEELLEASGDIRSDFAALVCAKRLSSGGR
jgi:2-polyprenyl-3-methyl-5-hydroxy-6-metoxy-1,4-benzoquinol methylase